MRRFSQQGTRGGKRSDAESTRSAEPSEVATTHFRERGYPVRATSLVFYTAVADPRICLRRRLRAMSTVLLTVRVPSKDGFDTPGPISFVPFY